MTDSEMDATFHITNNPDVNLWRYKSLTVALDAAGVTVNEFWVQEYDYLAQQIQKIKSERDYWATKCDQTTKERNEVGHKMAELWVAAGAASGENEPHESVLLRIEGFRRRMSELTELREQLEVERKVSKTYRDKLAAIEKLKEDARNSEQQATNWMVQHEQTQRNVDYYRGIVIEVGQLLGDECFVDDTGRRHDDILIAKVVEVLRARLTMLESSNRRLRQVNNRMRQEADSRNSSAGDARLPDTPQMHSHWMGEVDSAVREIMTRLGKLESAISSTSSKPQAHR